MKTATTVCGKCGAKISGDATGQVCPACLLETGLGLLTDEAVAGGDGHFGLYEIERHPDGSLCELGRGAMGVTYLAIDTSLQRKVALKIIKMDVAARSTEARERFLREARAAATLRHENIATIYQFGIREQTGQYFYAMELIEGETLEEHIRRAGTLSVGTAIDMARQITAALTAAEKHGLVHRDLKPANLMLVNADNESAGASTQRGGYKDKPGVIATALRRRDPHNPRRTNQKHEKLLVKIIDFGLAEAFHGATDPKSLTHDRFVGTPAFASPEQFEHSALDVRSDIYSLGETLWFTLTGKTPFTGQSVEEIHRAQQSNVLPVEQLKAAHVPSPVRSLLKSMLAIEPAARPGTRELATRLQRCSPEAGSSRRTRVALAAAVILILGVSWFFVFHSSFPIPHSSDEASTC